MSSHHGMNEAFAGPRRYCGPGTNPEAAADAAQGRFGRLFPELSPNYIPPAVLQALGAKGGPMDDAIRSTGRVSSDGPTAGHVIFGQFIDHDITLDVTTSLTANAGATPNVRTPTLDLDCIYGDGPEPHPYLYRDGAYLLTGADVVGASLEQRNDLARAANNRAIIGDPRNDENRIVSQLQLGVINFHNARCDELAATGVSGHDLYEQAKEFTTWHYQWAVVFDFLTAMCGAPVVHDILANGRRVYCHVYQPYIPVEFSVAAYRYGHSMVPQTLQVQQGASAFEFFGSTLGLGFTPVASAAAIVDWHELFVTPAGRTVQRAEKLDTSMATDLLDLPFVSADDEKSLATRNLLRGNVVRLPSGEAVARAVGSGDAEIALVSDRVRDLVATAGQDPDRLAGSPLWLYLLAEAEVIGRAETGGGATPGEGLGPVGARIVAEVLIGLLELDEHSFLGANRNWIPDPRFTSIGEMLASVNSADL